MVPESGIWYPCHIIRNQTASTALQPVLNKTELRLVQKQLENGKHNLIPDDLIIRGLSESYNTSRPQKVQAFYFIALSCATLKSCVLSLGREN